MKCVKHLRVPLYWPIEKTHLLQAFCRESVLWMNISHPNILRLLAVEIKPKTGMFSMISEMMTNGNIVNYIRVKKANRLQLVRGFIPRRGKNIDLYLSWRTFRKALNISTNPESFMEILKAYVDISITSLSVQVTCCRSPIS